MAKKKTSARPKKAVSKKKAAPKKVAPKKTAKKTAAKKVAVKKAKAVAKRKPEAVAKKKGVAKSKAVASKRVVTRSPEREVIGAGQTPRVITRGGAAAVQTPSGFPFTVEQIPNGVKEAAFLHSYRKSAWGQFEKLPLPTTNDEAWRRTDIRQLKRAGLQIADGLPKAAREALPSIPARLLKPLVGKGHGGQIVFGPGKTTVELSKTIAKQGVVFTDFSTAAAKHPDLLKKVLGKVVKPDEGKFAAMAGALAGRGVLLYVPKGVQVDEPLHSLLWGPGAGLAYFSHILVWVEDGASVTYVHESASPTIKEQSMHAGIVELHVGSGANLRFVELQSWGEHMWNFTHERARVQKDGNLDWIFGALGSHLTKNFSEINLEGEGSLGRMSGFYFTDGEQHLDHDTQQNHMAAHTTSDLLFKGALEEKSRSVWQGMIYVAPGAQRTDGYQANRNLVLSKQARADSIPGLEILADDVRCTHGATVGKIDPDEYFYLMSRGIPPVEARRLIVKGFFDPIMERIPFEGVRQRFQQAIVSKMK
ncbi:MAG: Fe-S cluster assembly protein SufD [Anaerolineales bacterium]|nr:MAG: Fe-S cluster assembly protein SufD [Anaerolineales bacterium]